MMICTKCSYKFDEGIFCPECGTKYDEAEAKRLADEIKKKRDLEQAKEKAEEQRLEKEQENARRIAFEKAETERIAMENEQKDIERRTIRGVLYKTSEEAALAQKEHDIVDALKNKLMQEKTQKKRQEIFKEFEEKIETTEVQGRLYKLKEKVYTKESKSIFWCRLLGISSLIAIFLFVILTEIGMEYNIMVPIIVMWYGFGVPVWVVWKVILVIKRKGKNHYSNLMYI